MGWGPKDFAVARYLQTIPIGLERGRRRFELLISEKLLDLEIREPTTRVELCVLRACGLSKLESQDKVPLRLTLERSRDQW